jgi:hypothetical protein
MQNCWAWLPRTSNSQQNPDFWHSLATSQIFHEILAMDRRFVRLVLGFSSLLALLIGAVAFYQLGMRGHGGFEFRMHRGRYEAIVQELLPEVPKHDSLYQFTLQDLDDPSSIHPLTSPPPLAISGQGRGHVWAIRKGESLNIWIETVDQGHAGEYGYAYHPDSTETGWDADRFGEYWSYGERLDDHWWIIYNDLN